MVISAVLMYFRTRQMNNHEVNVDVKKYDITQFLGPYGIVSLRLGCIIGLQDQ